MLRRGGSDHKIHLLRIIGKGGFPEKGGFDTKGHSQFA